MNRRIRRLPIRDDQKDELISALKRSERGGTLEEFDKKLALPWGVFCQPTPNVAKAKVLIQKRVDEKSKTNAVVKEIARYAIIQRRTPKAAFPSLLINEGEKNFDRKVLQSANRLLGRPVETIHVTAATEIEDIVGSEGQIGRVMAAVQRTKCCNPVIILKLVEELTNKKVENALQQLVDHKRTHSFVDRSIGVPFDLSNVFFVVRIAEERVLKEIRKSILRPILVKHSLEGREAVFDDSLLKLFTGPYVAGCGWKVSGVLDSIAVALKSSAITSTAALLTFFEEKDDDPADASPVPAKSLIVGSARIVSVRAENNKGAIAFMYASFSPKRLITNASKFRENNVDIVYNYCRENSGRFGFLREHLKKELKVQFPVGDGLSGGASTFLACFSLFSNRRIRRDSVTSGAITLAGRIMPIAGVKPKVRAIYDEAVRRVVFPTGNRVHVEREIDEDLKREMEFVYVNTLDELVEAMMEKEIAVNEEVSCGPDMAAAASLLRKKPKSGKK